VWLGESLESLAGHRRKRMRDLTGGTNGRRLCCSGVRKERQGVFIGQQRSKVVSPELRWPQWRRHGAEAVDDVRRADGQWRKAVRAPMSARRPRGLGIRSVSPALGAQCPRRPASDRWVFQHLGVRAAAGRRGVRGATSCRCRRSVSNSSKYLTSN
jgi:hypothetical protein